MDCPDVNLVAYHLACDSDDERSATEAHLVECSACLKTYLALKRASDRQLALERPRPEVRARLRAEVMRSFPARPSLGRRATRLFALRMPVYQGVALAALAAAIALVGPTVLDRVARSASGAGTPDVDTSRTHAESFHIY